MNKATNSTVMDDVTTMHNEMRQVVLAEMESMWYDKMHLHKESFDADALQDDPSDAVLTLANKYLHLHASLELVRMNLSDGVDDE